MRQSGQFWRDSCLGALCLARRVAEEHCRAMARRSNPHSHSTRRCWPTHRRRWGSCTRDSLDTWPKRRQCTNGGRWAACLCVRRIHVPSNYRTSRFFSVRRIGSARSLVLFFFFSLVRATHFSARAARASVTLWSMISFSSVGSVALFFFPSCAQFSGGSAEDLGCRLPLPACRRKGVIKVRLSRVALGWR